jgi:uncharacterized protein with von Willebrand factor type A (vWA) domain
MTLPPPLPRAARPFVTFGTLLRQDGFRVASEQIMAFLAAVRLLGPAGIADIRRAAHAMLAPPPERRADFDALFDAHFLGETVAAVDQVDAHDDETRVQEGQRGSFDPLISDDRSESGEMATAAEVLSVRRFTAESEADILRRFSREAPMHLPRRRGFRMRAAKRGGGADFRRTLREAVRNDGEVLRLPQLARKPRQRKVLLLIDVSGSMKERTDAHLRFAHALAGAVERIEVFTFGTRLTRLTRAMRMKSRVQALSAASAVVADWDGGTRIGDALNAFLDVPRFAGYARGAVTLVLSDGLERGDHRAMTAAVARLAARSWRLAWLTPLASDPRYVPETAALKSILPYVDDLADGSTTEALCAYVLGLAEARAA